MIRSGRAWTVFIWHRKRTCDGLLWIWYWNCGSLNMRGIFWLA